MPSAALILLLAVAPEPSQAALAWPIDCTPGLNCRVANLPDPGKTGENAFCRKNGIAGHEGTDVSISNEAMEHGVDVYAAEDGVVSWSFDGKFDRCPAPAEPDCREPSGPLAPGRRDGTTVCTPLGPFCRDGRGECFWCFAGGNVVVVLHERPDVFATRYDHFKKGSILVKPGEKVKKGQKLGEVGSAGRSTAPHLHFEVWGKTFYDPVDPWLGPCSPARGRSLWNRQPKPY